MALISLKDLSRLQFDNSRNGTPRQTNTRTFFSHNENHRLGTSAILDFPALGRSFEGYAKRTKELAEIAAGEVFRNDPDVRHIASLLPPSNEAIKKHVTYTFFKKFQRAALLERGESIGALLKEVQHEVYMGFQDLGCRTAIWDGNL